MKYVSSLPPVTEAPHLAQPEALSPTRAVRAVHKRLFPAHIAEHYQHHEAPAEAPEEFEKRSGLERRQYCRRLATAEALLGTRTSIERRRKSRRRDEPATAVDEEI